MYEPGFLKVFNKSVFTKAAFKMLKLAASFSNISTIVGYFSITFSVSFSQENDNKATVTTAKAFDILFIS